MRKRIVAVLAVATVVGFGCSSMMKTQPPSSAFEEGQSFEAQGVLLEVKEKEVRVARPGLPGMTLAVVERTQITLDGQPRQITAIPEGSEVRASFQVVDDRPIAVKLDVTSPLRQQE